MRATLPGALLASMPSTASHSASTRLSFSGGVHTNKVCAVLNAQLVVNIHI